ncbi:TlyA family RNA methyltransferase [Oerskovia flava]|uniref:TlyA family RNA methyltransferase n=1 Tax=Oerskovia flava TaxID=2986422 RepID=UPI00223FC682|nr:TlyA family RNA methyltransferase [Oerskovia sp. JB1-3-2]
MNLRVDAELVRRGLARSRGHAAALIGEGRVRVGETVVTKPAAPVTAAHVLVVEPDPADPGYASRAAYKLAGAFDALASEEGRALGGVHVSGAYCVDLGASTGGFTDVLLRRGARHVVAVDVGHGQLVEALRTDPRVTVHEGLNVRDLSTAQVKETPGLVVADLSFISLTTVLPAVAGVVGPSTDLLLMVKPQFEVGRERLGSGGVVRDPALHALAVETVASRAAGLGLRPLGIVPSPLPGPSGNREFFWWLRAAPHLGRVQVDVRDLARVATDAVSWKPAAASSSGPAGPGVPPLFTLGTTSPPSRSTISSPTGGTS